MNTVQGLIDGGFHPVVAQNMFDCFSRRIGEVHGKNEITDIFYDISTDEKRIKIKCVDCGNEIELVKPQGWKRWDKLKRTCDICRDNEKARKEQEKKNRKEAYQKFLENKKAERLRRLAEKEPYIVPVKFDESYIGRKNNRLKVIGIVKDNDRRKFVCECDCGNTTLVEPSIWEQGKVKSCGCLAKEKQIEHSPELDRIRRIRNGMIQRCYNPNSKAYKYYGSRGICICDEWLNNADAFIEWALQNGYRNDLSIDRINNDGIYEPSNCRWATAKMQANNQRHPKVHKPKYLYNGKMYHLYELCEMFDTSEPAIRYRMNNMGMSFEEALTAKKKILGRPRKGN